VRLLLPLLLALPAAAFEGRLVSPDGSPLARARVSVAGHALAFVTDDDGRFTVTPAPSLPLVLLVARGDGALIASVVVERLPLGGVLELVVETAASETVTVVGGLMPGPDLPPANAAVVIGAAELAQRTPPRLVDSLADIPGTGRVEDGASGVPTVRGLGRSRTLILLDDGRVTAERRAGPSATFLEPETLDGVEVVRGPGSIAYGSESFGGVIRARTRVALLDGEAGARWALVGASGTGELGAAADASVPFGSGALLLGAHYREFGDYDAPDGPVDNSAATFAGARASWQQPLGPGVLRVGYRYDSGRDIGKPAADSDVVRAGYPEETSHRLSWGYDASGPGGWSRLSLTGLLDAYELLTDRDRLATATAPRSLTRADVDARDYGVRAEGERALAGGTLLVGVDLSGRFGLAAANETFAFAADGAPAGSTVEVSIENARRDDWGVFATLQRQCGRLQLAAGMRGDLVKTRNDGGYFGSRSTSDVAPSGFAALSLPLAEHLEATVQAARGFRVPLLSDLYYRGVTGRGFITGNPDLEPETSSQLDLAVRWRRGPLSVAGYAYLYRIEDLIERYRAGADYFFRNRGEAEIVGAELEATVPLSRTVSLTVGAQWLRGEVRDDGSPLDDVPPAGAVATVRGEPAERWWWLVRGAAYASDERPGPTETAVAGYASLDAGAGVAVAAWLDLGLLARNLTDATFFQTADPNGVPAPGRSVQLTLRGRL
jgi:iron complex outermembrane receptor protein